MRVGEVRAVEVRVGEGHAGLALTVRFQRPVSRSSLTVLYLASEYLEAASTGASQRGGAVIQPQSVFYEAFEDAYGCGSGSQQSELFWLCGERPDVQIFVLVTCCECAGDFLLHCAAVGGGRGGVRLGFSQRAGHVRDYPAGIDGVADVRQCPAERGAGLVVLKQQIDTTTPPGRLAFHILGAIDEFQRELIIEGTREGLEAARARGRTGGRKPKLNARQAATVRRMYAATGPDGKRQHTVAEIAEAVGVHRTTVYDYLKKES